MSNPLHRISAISLFVEDLAAAKSFYRTVFGAEVVYEDATSVAVQFDPLLLNLLHVDAAHEIVAPGAVAPRQAGSRFQLSVWVDDIDAVCDALRRHGVELLAGPLDRAWGMRTANFVDPAGHSWEVAQKIGAD